MKIDVGDIVYLKKSKSSIDIIYSILGNKPLLISDKNSTYFLVSEKGKGLDNRYWVRRNRVVKL